jgi:hypothetical protein
MSTKPKCFVCGKEHDYCPTCSKTHGWKFFACTHEHFQIYITITDYVAENITKEEAKERFKNIGITAETDLSDLIPVVANKVRSIVGEKKVEKSTEKTTKKTK